jgi:hypothetical protein
MPTNRPRHTLTETDELAAALNEAARRWPADAGSRPRLLVRLIETGQRTLEAEREHDRERRIAALERAAGALTGVYPPDYVEQLRREWPE